MALTSAAALWCAWAHAIDRFSVAPILAIQSPAKRCGKTTLLRIAASLVPRPLVASNVTPAALFRIVEEHRPTLLVDEADTFVAGSDELRGLLNSGHTRDIDELCRLEDAPWSTLSRGKPITPHKLARLLAGFGIRRRHTEHRNIYVRSDFEPVWSRYCSASPSQSFISFTAGVSAGEIMV